MATSTDRSGQSNQAVSATFNAAEVKALKRSISDAGKEARKEVRNGLKRAGAIVQAEIRRRTPVYGGKSYGGKGRERVMVRSSKKSMTTRSASHTPGLLRRSTKLKIGRMSVTVYNDARAKYKGGFYRYGKRLEFDPAYAGRYAFWEPGWTATKGQARQAFDGVLTAAAAKYGGQ